MFVYLFIFISIIYCEENNKNQVKVDGFPVNLWIGHQVIQKDNKENNINNETREKSQNFEFLASFIKENFKIFKINYFITGILFIIILKKIKSSLLENSKMNFLTKNFLEKDFLNNENLILNSCLFLEDENFEKFFNIKTEKIINFYDQKEYKSYYIKTLNELIILKEKILNYEDNFLSKINSKIFLRKRDKNKIIFNINLYIKKLIEEISLI